MDLFLKRTLSDESGIISELCDANGQMIAHTLEHAYVIPDGEPGAIPGQDKVYLPKLYNGVFKCVRGLHQLEGMTHSFETFEIIGVEGHTNILFHTGNYNKDSAGCVLVGSALEQDEKGEFMILASKLAFTKFMALQAGLDSFTLHVI